MSNTYLHTYLNDHLGGSRLGVQLARTGARRYEGTPVGETFEWLSAEIEEDRKALMALMESLGAPTRLYKRAAASVGERLLRLKPNGSLFGRSQLDPLIDLEALSLGIEGKGSLWRSLAAAGVKAEGADLAKLEQRATEQRQRLEGHRGEVAAAALKGG